MAITIDQLKTYFNDYLKTYTPFKDENLYQAILTTLENTYFNNAYNIDPIELKTLYENSDILENIYDQLLVAVGVPQELADEFTYNSKVIFLKALSDFMRYKGTIQFLDKVGNSFDDQMNIYELYADWDNNQSKWVLKPVLIYKNDQVDIKDTPLDYLQIYNQVPTLLISPEHLSELKDSENIILPSKTNMLLLDYNITTKVSLMRDLITCTFIKEYRDNLFTMYFSDGQNFSMTLGNIVYIWVYLASVYHNISWEHFDLKRILSWIDYNNPYSVSDLDGLISEYNEIKTRTALDKFFNEKISIFFNQFYSTDKDYTPDNMLDIIEIIDPVFFYYLQQRIGNSSNVKEDYRQIMNDIYNSLMLYEHTTTDIHFKKYFSYFMDFLPKLTLHVEDTVTYKIIYNLKPYHVELVTKSTSSIIVDDKFNDVMIDDPYSFIFTLFRFDFVDMGIDYLFKMTSKYSDNAQLLSYVRCIIKHIISDQLALGLVGRDTHKIFMRTSWGSVINLSDIDRFKLYLDKESDATLLSIFSTYQKSFNNKDSSKIKDELATNIRRVFASLKSVSDNYEYKPKLDKFDSIEMVSRPVFSSSSFGAPVPTNSQIKASKYGDTYSLGETYEVLYP
jgi:hypothetical protein